MESKIPSNKKQKKEVVKDKTKKEQLKDDTVKSKNLEKTDEINKEENVDKKTKTTKEKEVKKKQKTTKKKDTSSDIEIVSDKKKNKKKKIKLKKNIKIIIIIVCIILIILALAIIFINSNQKTNDKNNTHNSNNNQEISNNQEEINEELEVYDINSNSRPLAVMISNDGTAKKRQYGIQKAYLVYEITVEGGITRLMALFKDADVEKIGPVRSSRHYYLDYVLENDAIYTHYGWSPQAESDISSLGINNLNGLVNPSNMFWRDSNYSSPNNAYTSSENIKKASESKKYDMTSSDYKLLNYKKEVDLSNDETYKEATNIKINYSGAYVKYVYDNENKYYLRYNSDNKHLDLETNEQVHVKNILVLKMDTKTIENDSAGRQNLYNIGTGSGYYISNGQSIEITWNKENRESKTIYKNLKGEEIDVNDGNTFIQIQPINNTLTIE